MKATKAISGVMAAAMSVAMLATSLTAFAASVPVSDYATDGTQYSVTLDARKWSDPSQTSMAAQALNDSNSYFYYDTTDNSYKLYIDFDPISGAAYGFPGVTANVSGLVAKDANGATLPVSYDSTNTAATITITSSNDFYDPSSYNCSGYAFYAKFSTDGESWFLNNILKMVNPEAYVVFEIGDAIE